MYTTYYLPFLRTIPFFSFIYFFLSLVKKSKPVKIDEISPEENYKTRNRALFLKSFQESEMKEYSSNIEPIFYTREEYNKAILDPKNTIEPVWKRRILFEFTPRGNLIMYYDSYKEGFAYYSDTQITYDILNAAAMKYSILFRCRDFFSDELQYPAGSTLPLLQLKESIPQEKHIKPRIEGPFIKPKKHTTNAHKNLPAEKIYSKNKFLYLGKICNFSVLSKEKVIRPVVETKYSSIFDGEQQVQSRAFDYRKFKESRSLT